MTSSLNRLQMARDHYRKSSSKIEYNILTLIIGELETVSKRDGQPITDEKVTAAIKKLIKSDKETLKLKGADKTLEAEIAYLESWLPEEMSEEQLRDAIKDSGASNIGQAMKALASNPDAVYDKGLASKVAKELFS